MERSSPTFTLPVAEASVVTGGTSSAPVIFTGTLPPPPIPAQLASRSAATNSNERVLRLLMHIMTFLPLQ
jgi:hypothetical protein